jgi:hypothetical protein
VEVFENLISVDSRIAAETEVVPLPLAIIGLEGYSCIEKFFWYMNHRQKLISHIYNKQQFTVESTTLLGFDVLLRVYLQATDEAVVKAASELIVNLNVKLSGRLVRRSIWEAFTRRCAWVALFVGC